MNRLVLKQIVYTYADGTEAISGIDLTVKRGEFIGILGYNGSGKTTLLKVMDGLIKDFKGKVLLDGKDIRDSRHGRFTVRWGLFSRIPTTSFSPLPYSRMWRSVR